jgi:transcriptional regulator with XRE-family HTH domain
MEIGKTIRQIRELKNISQEYMANELSISQPTYAKIESGQLVPKVDRLKHIADILEVDLSTLINTTQSFTITFNSTANQSGYINHQNNTVLDAELVRQIIREELDRNRES